jgi:hypothetical protein
MESSIVHFPARSVPSQFSFHFEFLSKRSFSTCLPTCELSHLPRQLYFTEDASSGNVSIQCRHRQTFRPSQSRPEFGQGWFVRIATVNTSMLPLKRRTKCTKTPPGQLSCHGRRISINN